MQGNGDNVNYINPPNYLKQKVGSGGLPEKTLVKAQDMIDTNDIDFSTYIQRFLDLINTKIDHAQKSDFRTHDHVTTLIYPVMQLKAHGGMFRQPLISDVSASALMFLENIYILDDDAIEVIRAHQKALKPIVKNKILGFGGASGQSLVNELQKLCLRYFKKHDITPDN